MDLKKRLNLNSEDHHCIAKCTTRQSKYVEVGTCMLIINLQGAKEGATQESRGSYVIREMYIESK